MNGAATWFASRRPVVWLAHTFELNRALVILIFASLGILLGYVYYDQRTTDQRAADARKDLRARDRKLTEAIRDIQRLKNPTAADIRRIVDRELRAFTRPQLRRLLERLLRGARPEQLQRLRGAPSTGGAPGSRAPPSRGGPPASTNPPGESPGNSPGIPPGNPPTPRPPSAPRPPRPPPPELPPILRPIQPIVNQVCQRLPQVCALSP